MNTYPVLTVGASYILGNKQSAIAMFGLDLLLSLNKINKDYKFSVLIMKIILNFCYY